jgi:hypothetical protein
MAACGKVAGNIETFNKAGAVSLIGLHFGIYPDPAEGAVIAEDCLGGVEGPFAYGNQIFLVIAITILACFFVD